MAEYKWKYWQTTAATLALILSGYLVADKLLERETRFYPGPGYINFNSGSVNGWKLYGLYDGDTKNKIANWNLKPIWADNTDFSNKPKQDPFGDNKGSIIFPMGPGVPKSTTGKWRVDFVSPDLTGDPKWKGIKGISAAICDRTSWNGLTNLEVRFVAIVKKPDGSVYELEEKANNSANPKYHKLKAQLLWEWNYVSANLILPKDHAVQMLYVKFYGIAGPNVYSTGFVALDAITPF